MKRAEYLGEIQILESFDYHMPLSGRPRSAHLVEGGIRKGEIICAISGESAKVIQKFMDNEELELVIQALNPVTKEVDEAHLALGSEVDVM